MKGNFNMNASKIDLTKQIFANNKKIQEAVIQKTQSNSTKDETFWTPPWDDSTKTGLATIAFLPFANAYDEENKELSPFIFIPTHGTMLGKNGRKIYNIVCPSSKPDFQNGDCPICNKFFDFYNGTEEDKKLGANLSLARKRYFYSNIIILKNDSNPEEVGKIFKWRYGAQIQLKINSKIVPMDGDEPIYVHNPNDILPLKVKITEKNKYRTFENSEWQISGKSVVDYLYPKANAEEKKNKMIEILDGLYKVEDFITEKDYKSKEELQDILNEVLEFNKISVEKVETTVEQTKENSIFKTAVIEEKEEDIGNELTIDEKDKIETSDDLDLDDIFNE
jgi:hypothetical protein